MGAIKFEPKKLRMLSPDADDWNELVGNLEWLNQENCVYGVLLYPKKGITKHRAEVVIKDWIDERDTFGHGSFDTTLVMERGDEWAFIYQITAWYNHFDLNEEYD